jgi:hypothetical protein
VQSEIIHILGSAAKYGLWKITKYQSKSSKNPITVFLSSLKQVKKAAKTLLQQLFRYLPDFCLAGKKRERSNR